VTDHHHLARAVLDANIDNRFSCTSLPFQWLNDFQREESVLQHNTQLELLLIGNILATHGQ